MPNISSHSYSIIEPHPSAPSNTYMLTGRGGAGNLTRAPPTITRGSDASGPPSYLPASTLTHQHPSNKSSKPFTTGRGGAGNIVSPPSERAIFSFDEELERQLRRETRAAPVYSVGRGGAGNVYARPQMQMSLGRRESADSDVASGKSASSADSGADFATRKMKMGWKKIVGGH